MSRGIIYFGIFIISPQFRQTLLNLILEIQKKFWHYRKKSYKKTRTLKNLK